MKRRNFLSAAIVTAVAPTQVLAKNNSYKNLHSQFLITGRKPYRNKILLVDSIPKIVHSDIPVFGENLACNNVFVREVFFPTILIDDNDFKGIRNKS
jgi:hypothetical protein